MTNTRRQAIQETGLLDSPPEAAFDRLTRMACRLLGAPVSLVSIVDEERQFFKSAQGLAEPWATLRQTPLSHSFCQHVVASAQPLIVADAREHPALCDNLAIPELNVVAYLGIPLRTPDDVVIGSLCAIDSEPRLWSDEDVATLSELADMVMTEIAARHYHRAQEALAQRAQLKRHMLNAVEQAVIAIDLTGTILFWNRFAETLYGWPAEEVLGQNITGMLSAPEMQAAGREIMERLRQGQSWSGEFIMQRRDGTQFPAYVMDAPIQDAEGNLIGVVGVSFDITQRKASEEALRAQERLLRKLIDNLFTFVGLLTPEGILIEANRTALEAANLQPADVMGRPFAQAYWWSYAPDVQRQLEDAIQQCAAGKSSRYDVKVRLAEDRYIPIDFMLAPVFSETGEVTHLVPSGLDISDRKALEQELRQFAADLEERVDARTAELERSNRELQEFAYVASHDLQEPLRKIIAFADRLRSRFGAGMEPDALDYMERMQNAAERMKVLINDLLTLSRVTTRGEPFVKVDLRQIAAEVLDDLETALEAVDGRVTIGDLPTVEADPSQMSRLLQNLISNSLKFRNEQAAPAISIWSETDFDSECEKQRVRLLVQDNGVGFDEKYLDRIFQPFQRLHGRMDYPGTGMGLAICRRIVERHQGEITARSAPNAGATFIITLPAQQAGKVTSILEE
ncbi:MAG: PAS domain S-box protein [Caldilineaceae bacterium]